MKRIKQPNSDWCFVCGRKNPVGLQMAFYDNGEDEVYSDYTVSDHYQGYPELVHGGILGSILDEVVARVSMIRDQHRFMMSVKQVVKYRCPVPVNTPLRVVGRVVRLRGRLGKAEGKIYLPDETVACDCEMSLANVPPALLENANPSLLNWRVDP